MDKKLKDLVSFAEELKELIKMPYQKLITFQDIHDSFNLGEKKSLSGTINELIIKTPRHLRFLTTIPPLTNMDMQWHDCGETCRVMAGVLHDSVSNQKWEEGELAEFSELVEHLPRNPSAVENCYLVVDFYR